MNCVTELYLSDSQSNGLCTHVHFQVLFGVLNIAAKQGHPNALVYPFPLRTIQTQRIITPLTLPLSWCVSAEVAIVEGASKTLEADEVTILVPVPACRSEDSVVRVPPPAALDTVRPPSSCLPCSCSTVAVGVVTPLPRDVVIAGVVMPRLTGVDTVTKEGREVEVVEELSAVLPLPDETKLPWMVSDVLWALSVCSLPASLTVCADVTGVTEAEVEDGESRIGPIGARLARDPIFTVIPPGALFACNIDNGNGHQTCH